MSDIEFLSFQFRSITENKLSILLLGFIKYVKPGIKTAAKEEKTTYIWRLNVKQFINSRASIINMHNGITGISPSPSCNDNATSYCALCAVHATSVFNTRMN